MWSSAPDSSPMAAICRTIDGNTPVDCMEVVSAVPVETSFWICSVASTKTALPDAPPTESSASTSGTPAANMVRSEEHTSELQSQSNLVCRLLLEKKKKKK